ncbi:MAG: hypothetical protein GQ540_06350 [Lutibacter sp.]|uniref:M4 family metallopeptidase n=1 Tax=Lutibacter sp. TaxID=1925666 RepID=UPI0019DBA646|nr:M4 family metallopeptidase [Lutibacter sp.]NOR28133.1 hypothetical protein [Lutibacter sp.]
MKKKLRYQLILIVLFCLPYTAIGQVKSNTPKSYQKSMRFVDSNTINEAKEKFIIEFGLDDNTTFIEFQSNSDKKGGIHKKYQQYYKGIKVEYGTMIVHLKNGKVSSINGELYNPKDLNLVSNLTPTTALNKAIAHISAKTYLWDSTEQSKTNNYKKPEGELVIFPVLENGNSILKLAYKFDVYATVPISRGYVYINAFNGSFLFNDPIIKHVNNEYSTHDVLKKSNSNKSMTTAIMSAGIADTRYSGSQSIEARAELDGTFTLNDDIRNVHTYNAQNSPTNGTYQFTTVDFVDDDNVWSSAEFDNAARDNAALDAHWGAMNVYDFWNMLGRNSIDDAGMEMRSYVHVGTDYFNAFWNGSVMSYGDGTPNPLTSIDIVSHEMAHGVTTWTANLVYARESGAMNEGFSDIFGAAVEFFAKGTGTDSSPNAETWLLAEEFWPGGYLRSMSDPKSKGDPDTYNGTNYTDATSNCIPSSSNDYCGVHSNSGVLNHWFYILVAGKAGTNDAGDIYNVTGIGMTKAQEIAYLTLRDYLSPNSTFIDARNGAIEVAASLYGSNSIERQATQDAFYAVNVGDKFIPFDTDINLVEFTELVDITCGGDVIPKILVRNSGATNVINTIQINYSIDGISQTPFNWNGTLNINEEAEITLPAISEVTIKTYTLDVEAVVAGDGDVSNNTITSPFRVNRSDGTPTEVNTFDNFLVDYWLTYNEGEGSNLWLISSPDKTNLNTVTSGENAYVTKKTVDYPNETKAYLISPCYDLTAFTSPKMKFNMAFQLQENFDIIYVEYSTDAVNWSLLGSSTDPNWYNSNRIFESGEISSDCQNCPGGQWTGTNTAFSEFSYDLSSFKNEPNIIFRFVFHSDASVTDEGVVIDDFVIEELGVLADDDGDGVQNSLDLCAATPTGEAVDADGCSDSQLDDDGDGVLNDVDNCPETANPGQEDVDGDGIGDVCDNCASTPNADQADTDGDGVGDVCDNCPDTANADQTDSDFDGIGDACDLCEGSNDSIDTDGDGVPDGCDICPGSDDTVDADGDGVPDGCDICPGNDDSIDTDGDGIPDGCDNCIDTVNNDQADADGDGVGDVCDICPGSDDTVDTDGDGVPDGCDICPGNDDSIDTDGDGIPDGCDNCIDTVNNDQADADGDGVGDVCDSTPNGDTDNDGVDNLDDLCPGTPAGTPVDTTGCFALVSNNFNVEVISETCPDEGNGQILISAIEDYTYTTTINGIPSESFTKNDDFKVDTLEPGIYNLCISVTGQTFVQCFDVEVIEGEQVVADATVNFSKAEIEIKMGTAPYTIYVNGEESFKTSSPVFNVDVKHGDLIEVKTAKSCEGTFSKTIELLDEIVAYPNPTNGIFDIALPVSQKEVVIELYTIHSQLISTRTYPITYGNVQLTLENQPTGLYIAKVKLESPIILKIIKH